MHLFSSQSPNCRVSPTSLWSALYIPPFPHTKKPYTPVSRRLLSLGARNAYIFLLRVNLVAQQLSRPRAKKITARHTEQMLSCAPPCLRPSPSVPLHEEGGKRVCEGFCVWTGFPPTMTKPGQGGRSQATNRHPSIRSADRVLGEHYFFVRLVQRTPNESSGPPSPGATAGGASWLGTASTHCSPPPQQDKREQKKTHPTITLTHYY